MIQIRRSIFETNSSSVHTLTMCTKEAYEKFRNGELFITNKSCNKIFRDYPTLINVEQLREIGIKLSKDETQSRWYNEDFENMPDYELIIYFRDKWDIEDVNEFYRTDLESFEEEYTTPNGETVVAFGVYGYDG